MDSPANLQNFVNLRYCLQKEDKKFIQINITSA